MNMQQLIAITSLVAAALIAPHARAEALADDTYIETVADSITKADDAFRNGRFLEAYGFYHWAAIRDDPRSQEMVGFMLLMGPEMFGKGVRQDREEAAFWLGEAAKRGRLVARRLLPALTATQSAQRGTHEPMLK